MIEIQQESIILLEQLYINHYITGKMPQGLNKLNLNWIETQK